MALTISIEGIGELSSAESLTNWGVDGSGGVSLSLNTETVLEQSNSISAKVGSGKHGWIYYDYGTAVGTLDFNGGNADGNYVYIWYNTTTPGFTETFANGGLAVQIGTDISNYRRWILHHSTNGLSDLNGYAGGWNCAVIDPTSTGSGDTGTYSADTVNLIGMFYAANANSVADNFFVDAILVGKGLRITGTGATDDWQDVVNYATAYASRAWGMIQEKQGIYFIYGKLFVGSSASAIATTLDGTSRVFRFADQEYYTNSSTLTSTMANHFGGIVIEDNASGVTDYSETGSTFIGAKNYTCDVLLNPANNSASDIDLDGVTYLRMQGTITLKNDTDHTYSGVIFDNCGQVNPVGAPVIRSCIFQNYSVSTSGALLWNSNIDIQNCIFRNNVGTHTGGIEHTSGTSATYTDLTFSGNTVDVVNDQTTNSLTINKSGTSNPSTSYTTGTGSVTFVGSVTIKITVKDIDGNPIVGARVFIQAGSTGAAPYLDSVTITSSSTTATVSHTAHGLLNGQYVIIRGADQQEYNGWYTISNVTTNSYDYTFAGSLTTPATGTITSTQGFMNEETISDGTATESFNAGTTQSYEGRVRESTTTNSLYKLVTFSGSDISGGINLPVQLTSDE